MSRSAQSGWESARPNRRPVYMVIAFGAIYLWWSIWSRSLTVYPVIQILAFGSEVQMTAAAPRSQAPAKSLENARELVASVEEHLTKLDGQSLASRLTAQFDVAQDSNTRLMLRLEEEFLFDSLLQAADGWRASGALSANHDHPAVQIACAGSSVTVTLDTRMLDGLQDDVGLGLALDEVARKLGRNGLGGMRLAADRLALLKGSNGHAAAPDEPRPWPIRIVDPRENAAKPIMMNLLLTDASIASAALPDGRGVIVITRHSAAWAAAFARGVFILEPQEALSVAASIADTKVLLLGPEEILGATGGLDQIVVYASSIGGQALTDGDGSGR